MTIYAEFKNKELRKILDVSDYDSIYYSGNSKYLPLTVDKVKKEELKTSVLSIGFKTKYNCVESISLFRLKNNKFLINLGSEEYLQHSDEGMVCLSKEADTIEEAIQISKVFIQLMNL